MPELKEIVRTLATHAVVYTGVTTLGRKLADRSGALILYGHRVSKDDEGYMQGLNPAWLDQQLAYLTRHFEVISLAQLVKALRSDRGVPHHSVVLTFDDGFRDNYQKAFPLFVKHRVPATIFAVTGDLTNGDLPWSQRLGYVFQKTSEARLVHYLNGYEELTLDTPEKRKSSYRRIKQLISKMPREERDSAILDLSQKLSVDPPRNRMMTWDQAREMHAAGIEFGAHTYSHPLLAEMTTKEALWEIKKSRDDLNRELGVSRPSFCFPAGSLNRKLLARVPHLGFYCTFVPGQGIRINNSHSVNPYTLSRTGLPNAPAPYLEAELDGPFHALRRLVGRT
ncbi:MAG: polysaccharide deacetylase family protein [Verrucomicrobia bacterium]|jgi:peptidoglycan/xylan/chitin deacetylase (PgdA/CDA1 family)|nr:polysaccharide deacetylase family protein [Verrucomicrobiota bacterium]